MIHLPEYDPSASYIGGNKYDLETYMADLVLAEAKLLKYYVDRTGKPESVLADMLAANKGTGTSMTADEAVANGFATGLYQNITQVANRRRPQQPIFAMAKYGRPQQHPVNPAIPSNSTDIMSKLSSAASALMNAANGLLGLANNTKTLNNLKLGLANGTSIDVSAAGDIANQGDTVKNEAGEVLADGDYETTDGQILTVAAGAISNIKTKESGQPVSQEPVNENPSAEEIANLRTEVARLQNVENQFNDFKARTTTVITNMQKALGDKQSLDPATRAPQQQIRNQQVTEGADADRQQMFEDRKNTDWGSRRTGVKRPGKNS